MSTRSRPARRKPAVERAPLASRIIDKITEALGHPGAVAVAASIVVAWLAFGPLFGYNDTYQLVINTATTIVTFVMVFAIQHTTNRETHAINLKLDELLEAVHGADDKLVGVETASSKAIRKLSEHEKARAAHNDNGAAKAGQRRRGTADERASA
jgi:low affinity Fe/Cu permease